MPRLMKMSAPAIDIGTETRITTGSARNHLKGREGDRIDAVLAAAGYNFGLLLRWLAELLRALITALLVSEQKPETA